MIPMAPPSQQTQIVQPASKITREQIARILEEESGGSALLVMLRDDRIDKDVLIDALTKFQSSPYWKLKRVLMAFVESVLP
jgi:hypothetical protein